MEVDAPWKPTKPIRGDMTSLFDDLRTAVELSHKSLGKIGEGDWTPQDSVHMHLLCMVEKVLAADPKLRTVAGRPGTLQSGFHYDATGKCRDCGGVGGCHSLTCAGIRRRPCINDAEEVCGDPAYCDEHGCQL